MSVFIKKHLILFVLLFLSCIPLLDLLNSGLPVTHDGQDHVARIANFYQNLQEGNIIPRWASSLNWGYGHPILMFLYPLPSYTTSIFHFIGFNLVDGMKIVFALSFVLSGLTMYLWMRSISNDYAGFIAGMLYMFAPYRFVDLYVRGAIGEHVAFVFPPLILFFLYQISKKNSYWFMMGGILSLGGLILSHNAITLMFLPIIILYGVYLILMSKTKLILIYQYTSILVFGFGISSFFWIPAFFEGKYTLRDIVTNGDISSRFVEAKDFFYGKWSYGGTGQFTVQIGILQWVFVIVGICYTFLKKTRYRLFLTSLLFLFAGSLFIMTSYSHFIWQTLSTLQKFQFPWRFLSVSVFATAVIGGIVIYQLPKKFNRTVLILTTVLLLFFNKDYWYAKAYTVKPMPFYGGIYNGTTDTGESAPIWSVRFMEKRPKARVEIIEGKGTVREKSFKTTEHIYTVTADEKVRIRDNTLYFPGWNVYNNNNILPIEFQDQRHRGLITYFLEKGEHTIVVRFSETKLRLFADIITIASIIFLAAGGFFWSKIWKVYR